MGLMMFIGRCSSHSEEQRWSQKNCSVGEGRTPGLACFQLGLHQAHQRVGTTVYRAATDPLSNGLPGHEHGEPLLEAAATDIRSEAARRRPKNGPPDGPAAPLGRLSKTQLEAGRGPGSRPGLGSCFFQPPNSFFRPSSDLQ